jgi:hypothetical protein
MTQIELGPGQLIYGGKTWARELGLPLTTLWRRMKRLEKLNCISMEKDTHYSIVSIVNWGLYQRKGGKSGYPTGTPTDTQRASNGTPTDTNKKGEKDKNGENGDNGEKDETGRDDHRCSWGVVGGHVLEMARKVAAVVRVKESARANDRSIILKACFLVVSKRLPENWLWDAVEAVKQGKAKGNSAAYFTSCLEDGAERLGKKLARLLTTCESEIPAEILNGNRASERQTD